MSHQMYWKVENKEKEAGNGPFKKITLIEYFSRLEIGNLFESNLAYLETGCTSILALAYTTLSTYTSYKTYTTYFRYATYIA